MRQDEFLSLSGGKKKRLVGLEKTLKGYFSASTTFVSLAHWYHFDSVSWSFPFTGSEEDEADHEDPLLAAFLGMAFLPRLFNVTKIRASHRAIKFRGGRFYAQKDRLVGDCEARETLIKGIPWLQTLCIRGCVLLRSWTPIHLCAVGSSLDL